MSVSLIDHVVAGHVLTRREAEELMEEILSGRASTPEIVRLLQALNARPVDKNELAGFASAMRRHAAPVFADGQERPARLIDTCGTGGKLSSAFNISTAAGIVAAAAGARVAKHGNRSVSRRSGSADVLEALGVKIDLPLLEAGRAIREIGIGFLFAPTAHAATRHAGPARREIGARTVFNLLGPLTNPAGAHTQVLGVFSAEVMELMAGTLTELGIERALVVHGAGGMDEISLAGETLVAEVREGSVRRYLLTPEDFGVPRAEIGAVAGGSPGENAEMIRKIFAGESGARRDIVLVNVAAALMVSGVVGDLREGMEKAREAIDSGAAAKKLDELIGFPGKEKTA